jgi:glycerol-3-phosphate dehydrogenase
MNNEHALASNQSPVVSKNFGPAERRDDIKKISSEIFDVLVIGGGITGAAIARDAALRGLKVLLVEKDDFASGTSSRSSKLIHGGVRYLEQFEFKLVFEATRERARLWKLAPHLVSPLGFVFPTFKHSRVPLWKLNIGLWLYDILSQFRSPTLHKKWGREETLQNEPKLNADGLKGSIFYWDAATDDALLTLANILDAREAGATCVSRMEVSGIRWNPRTPANKTESHQIFLRDNLSGTAEPSDVDESVKGMMEKNTPENAELKINSTAGTNIRLATSATDGNKHTITARARVVISAAGPWSDSLLTTVGKHSRKLLAPTRGSHIVVPFEKLPSKHAVVLFHPKDGRVLFTIPWGEFTVVGTTDVFDDQSPDHTACTRDEVQYLIDAAKSYFPSCTIETSDIVSTWSGLRPLLAPPDKASASSVSREHHIEWLDPGMLVIAGGKLTTHREMAEQAVERVLNECANWGALLSVEHARCSTHTRPVPRTLYSSKNAPTAATIGVTEAARFDLAQVEGMLHTQMVLSLEDFMVRRTHIFYKENNNGLDLLEKLKGPFQKILGWDETTWLNEVEAYKNYVKKNVWIPTGRTK